MTPEDKLKADVVIVGGGLAGLTAAIEFLDRNKSVILLDRDTTARLGGLAKESFGGIMMVDTPLQRRSGIHDSPEQAFEDWLSYADFDAKDAWPRKWAEAYCSQTHKVYEWLTGKGVGFLPIVNWPERGQTCRGNRLPRWHIAWGTGHRIIDLVVKHLHQHPQNSRLTLCYNHRVEGIIVENNRAVGVRGRTEDRGNGFSAFGEQVVLSAGGICGGDLQLVKKSWYPAWGKAPSNLLNGSHRFADGLVHQAAQEIGGCVTHLDKQWHYAAGIQHPDQDGIDNRGLSLVPPRSAIWVNALGQRIGPPPLVGYTDTRYLVEQICQQPGQYSWQVLNWKIAIKELAVSGCRYMTAFLHRRKLKILWELLFGNKELVRRLLQESPDAMAAPDLPSLVQKMNAHSPEYQVDLETLRRAMEEFDRQLVSDSPTDLQIQRLAEFRRYKGDRVRLCNRQRLLDAKAGPFIAFKERILSRKSLGGIQTDLNCQVLREDGAPIEGLYAIGETSGFGGGGIHGKRSLEGTFLGSCVFTGIRVAQS